MTMLECQKYRKKPAVIEARQFNGPSNAVSIVRWIGETGRVGGRAKTGDLVCIDTLEGTMRAVPGDWIIKGVKGEFYPCKPDIFAATYEPVLSTITPAEVGGLVERLRGIYRIPITDGLGAVGSGEDPDNPNEFVRKFDTPPIQREAADAIEALTAALASERAAHAEARKALGMMLKEHDILSGNFGDVMDPKHKRPDRWPTAAEAARRALEGDTND